MSDPLSVAASVAGITSLADVVFRTVFKFWKAAKDAKGEIQAIADEINNLSAVLRSLQALAFELEAEGGAFDPTLRSHYLSHCKKTLDRIDKRTKKALDTFNTKASKLEGLATRLKWPFNSSETEGLMEEILQHKQTISIALGADSMRKLQLALSKMDQLSKDAASIARDIKEIKINTQISVDNRRQQVLDYFMKISPQQHLQTSISIRHPLTGLWLTESPGFSQWLETEGSRLWLSGIPGAGKTVLAGAVVQEALTKSYKKPNIGVGFFFCDYKDYETWEVVNILGAIAAQLALQKDEAFDVLDEYYNALHPLRGLARLPEADELRGRITTMCEMFTQAIVIIDGLDECGDNTDTVVEILSELSSYTTGLSMALLSRDHYNIRVHLEEEFEHIPIAAHTEDIRLYVTAELEKRILGGQLRLTNLEIKHEILETLVSRAAGMFRWVVCQLDYLGDCAHDEERLEALQKLPPDLPESYRRLLERVNRCSARVKNIVQMCLQFIAFAEPKMTIFQLRQAVSTPESLNSSLDGSNTISEQEIARRCSSLIRKSEDKLYFEFAHFSVQEFLVNHEALQGINKQPNLAFYHIEEATSLSLMAAQCLRFLQLKNFKRQPAEDADSELKFANSREEQYPFYRYSALQWLHFTKSGLQVGPILELAKSLFNASKTANFSAWAVEVFYQVLRQASNESIDEIEATKRACRTVSEPSFRPLHMAAALNLPEICAPLVRGSSIANARSGTVRPLDLAMVTIIGAVDMKDLFYGPGCVKNYEVIPVILPSAERRSETIQCLSANGGQLSEHPLSSDSLSSFMITCHMSVHFNDLSPIITLLSSGVVPNNAEIENLKECVHLLTLNEDVQYEASSEHEKSTSTPEDSSLALLEYLTDTKLYTTDWGSQIGSIVWNWGLQNKLEWTNNPFLLDSKLSLSEEALITQALTAVRGDDAEMLIKCLADDRLDKDKLYDEECGTLLHLATRSWAYQAMNILLTHGCNPYLEDDDGNLPVHVGCKHGSCTQTIEIFHEHNVSLLSQNKGGSNIVHLWAKGEIYHDELLIDLCNVDPQAASEAMTTVDLEGDTPLMVALEAAASDMSYNEDTIDSLISYVGDVPGFWEEHPTVIGLAAALGSETVLQALVDAGAKLDPVESDNWTPLHQLGAKATVACAEILESMYSNTCELKSDGSLPVELYLARACVAQTDLELVRSVVIALSPPSILPELWQLTCNLMTRSKDWEGTWGQFDYQWQDYDFIDSLLDHGITNGAMSAYENQSGESGLIPAFQGFLDQKGWVEEASLHLKPETLGKAIAITIDWASAKESHAALRFLKQAIKEKNLPLVKLLLENGMNIHQRVDKTSAIEYACQASKAYALCQIADGKAMIAELLKHSNPERLKDFTPDDDGLGLLHRLATKKNASEMLWLVKDLAARGVDVNGISQGSKRRPVIAHHVNCGSFQCAEVLLDLGADPTLASSDSASLDAAQAAIMSGSVSFLRKLLSHSRERALTMSWNRTFDMEMIIEGTGFNFTSLNAVHLAVIVSEAECAEFYLDEGLIIDINTTTGEGHTPLHFAAMRDLGNMIDFLVSRKADVMARSHDGSTPLHLAVRNGHLSAVKALLSKGAFETMDALAMTPSLYASKLGFDSIQESLEEAIREMPEHGLQRTNTLSRVHIKLLSEALQGAIKRADLPECKRLISSGCPIDGALPECHGCSPLILAVKLEKVEIAEWLIGNGASALKGACPDEQSFSLLEIAIGRVALNSVLPKLVNQFIAQGGNLVDDEEYPLFHAVSKGNTKGAEILLQCLEENLHSLGQTCQLNASEILPRIINKQARYSFPNTTYGKPGSHTSLCSVLHVAVFSKQKDLVTLLIKKGATFERSEPNRWTPLMYANDDMARLLLDLGASPRELYSGASFSLLLSWWGSYFADFLPVYFENVSPANRLDMSMLSTSSNSRCPVICEDIPLTSHRLIQLINLGIDLAAEDEGGRSLMHCLLSKEDTVDALLRGDYGLQRTTPFPWHLMWCAFGLLAFLRSRFGALLNTVGRAELARICNLQPSKGWSPLCRAASLDLVDVMHNCLLLGAEVGFDGCPLGSALMVASACGNLNAVKLLVNAGASIFFVGSRGQENAFRLTQSEAIKRYLLVGRFHEQKQITNMAAAKLIKSRVGIGHVALQLVGKLERQPSESTFDYAKRLALIRKSWQGKVVPTRL